jgi:hypothetical protein
MGVWRIGIKNDFEETQVGNIYIELMRDVLTFQSELLLGSLGVIISFVHETAPPAWLVGIVVGKGLGPGTASFRTRSLLHFIRLLIDVRARAHPPTLSYFVLINLA